MNTPHLSSIRFRHPSFQRTSSRKRFSCSPPRVAACLLLVSALPLTAQDGREAVYRGHVQGPVVFFTPYFWSRASVDDPRLSGMFFDSRPSQANKPFSMETQKPCRKRVEKLHRHWTKDREYLAPPTVGKLADIAPALIVTPPAGLEVGYVPIATRQAAAE